MIVEAVSARNGIRSRLTRAALSILTLLFCVLAVSLLSAGDASAHVLHSSAAAQADLSNAPIETSGDETRASIGNECGVECCSPAHCSAGLIAGSESTLSASVTDAFNLPHLVTAAPFEQSTLKRPPRS